MSPEPQAAGKPECGRCWSGETLHVSRNDNGGNSFARTEWHRG
jgi:hypothetical protein